MLIWLILIEKVHGYLLILDKDARLVGWNVSPAHDLFDGKNWSCLEVNTMKMVRWNGWTEIYLQRMMYTKWSTTSVSPKQAPWYRFFFIVVQIASNNIVWNIKKIY